MLLSFAWKILYQYLHVGSRTRYFRRKLKRSSIYNMVLRFGELPVRIRKIVYYTLCATHQRFWAKSISHGLPNFLKRSMHALVPMAPAFLSTVVIIKWANEEYRRSKRKDRKLYERDT